MTKGLRPTKSRRARGKIANGACRAHSRRPSAISYRAERPIRTQRRGPHGPAGVSSPAMARISLRLGFAGDHALGPGKIRLLELIGETGSISAAGRAMKMSYRRAWMLVDELNHMFREVL